MKKFGKISKIMIKDSFKNFQHLKKYKRENIDYKIISSFCCQKYLIASIHGGYIEYFTSQIAHSIAQKNFSLYDFQGLGKNSKNLHITSSRYDEKTLNNLLEKTQHCIAIHGYDCENENVIIGGKNKILSKKILEKLSQAGYNVQLATTKFLGKNKNNICNRSKNYGIQLEISRGLRKKLYIENKIQDFGNIINSCLE